MGNTRLNVSDNSIRLGIDIGGTSVKFAILKNEEIVHKSSILTEKNLVKNSCLILPKSAIN